MDNLKSLKSEMAVKILIKPSVVIYFKHYKNILLKFSSQL